MAKIKNGLDNYPDERLAEFLDKLEVLFNEYGLFISGCGCCGSPSIESLHGIKATFTYNDKCGGSSALDLSEESHKAWLAATD